MNKLIAFHGKASLKAEYVARVKAHAAADEIIHGQYWENGKGCAVGCTIHGSRHADYESVLGIPQMLARFEDTIFEGLQNGESKKFPLQFLMAIKPGADLSLVGPKLLLAIQKRNIKRLDAKKWPEQAKAIKQVIAVLTDFASTGKMDESAARSAADSAARSAADSAARSAAWSAARSAADSAARSAADSAARSAAWSAACSADSAARSADSAACSAAWSAACSAAWSAAWSADSASSSADYSWMARELIKLLKKAPVRKAV